jgi:hypothetical protein
MPALVTGNGNSLNIFLDGAIHNFLHLAIVTKVDYLHTCALQYTPHNIDGSIVSVEQCGSCNNPDRILWFVFRGLHRNI